MEVKVGGGRLPRKFSSLSLLESSTDMFDREVQFGKWY